jgi:hypothetical protein
MPILKGRSSGGRMMNSRSRQNTRSVPRRKFRNGGFKGKYSIPCEPSCTGDQICVNGNCQDKQFFEHLL